MMAPAPIAVDAKGAAALFSISPRSWSRWHAAGLCPVPHRVAGCVRWSTAELLAWSNAGCPTRARWLQMQRTGVQV